MFKKTSAFIKGTWDGVPDESNFTQNEEVYASRQEFIADCVNEDIYDLANEYKISGDVIEPTLFELSADGKVLIFTRTFVDQSAWERYKSDSRWEPQNSLIKGYNVEAAPTPEQIGTFNEVEGIYYHSVAELS